MECEKNLISLHKPRESKHKSKNEFIKQKSLTHIFFRAIARHNEIGIDFKSLNHHKSLHDDVNTENREHSD